jgi:hypothetical protein
MRFPNVFKQLLSVAMSAFGCRHRLAVKPEEGWPRPAAAKAALHWRFGLLAEAAQELQAVLQKATFERGAALQGRAGGRGSRRPRFQGASGLLLRISRRAWGFDCCTLAGGRNMVATPRCW